jgi:hypothetical protein
MLMYLRSVDTTTILAIAILHEVSMADETMRYAVRQELDLGWTVYDVFTGGPAMPSTYCLTNLSESQADMYCTVINARDIARRQRVGFPFP